MVDSSTRHFDEPIDVKVKKHSALVQISGSKLTSVQRKIFLALLFAAGVQKKIEPMKSKYYISFAYLKKLSGVASPNNSEFYSHLESMMRIQMRANFFEKDKNKEWSAFNLLAGASMSGPDLVFSFPHQVDETLVEPDLYTVLDMSIARSLKNKYALTLYELAYDYRKVGMPTMSVGQFRELFGVADEYMSFKDLNKHVIKKAVEEVNSKSDIFVTADTRKENGKTVSSIKFNIKRDPVERSTPAELEDKILTKEVLAAIDILSSGKSFGYQASLMTKIVDGDLPTKIIIDRQITENRLLKNNLAIDERVRIIQNNFLGTNISLKHGEHSQVCKIVDVKSVYASSEIELLFNSQKNENIRKKFKAEMIDKIFNLQVQPI